VRISFVCGEDRTRVVGTTLGQLHRPHRVEDWGQGFKLQMDGGRLALFRYQDVRGMVGRVGTTFGEHGVNITAAAVGRQPPGGGGDLAVMAITTDAAIPQGVIDEIVATDGFIAGRAVPLGA
jgi:D-3-phosphoglycerate dehydrogenase